MLLFSVDHLILPVPKDFNFEYCLSFLGRSPRELLHRIDGDRVYKVLRHEGHPVLFSVGLSGKNLLVEFPDGVPPDSVVSHIREYVSGWFDLSTDLKPFYAIASKDALLAPLARKYRGLRIMGHPELFESLVWAILGQQINLAFAYTLKERFVREFGDSVEVKGHRYFMFPGYESVAGLAPEQLHPLQFSRQKAAYVIGIARAFASGQLSKKKIAGLTLVAAKDELMKVKGIGNWTANYALLRTFRYPDAFPLEDAGLHNAIKNQLGLRKKPSLARVKKIFKAYREWEAYATVYLWKSL